MALRRWDGGALSPTRCSESAERERTPGEVSDRWGQPPDSTSPESVSEEEPKAKDGGFVRFTAGVVQMRIERPRGRHTPRREQVTQQPATVRTEDVEGQANFVRGAARKGSKRPVMRVLRRTRCVAAALRRPDHRACPLWSR